MTDPTLLALDIGTRRIGLARAHSIALLAEPLDTWPNDDQFIERLNKLIEEQNVVILVAGLPRGLSGNQTEQTRFTEDFVAGLRLAPQVHVYMHDEALSSVAGESTLRARKKAYDKSEIDAAAAAHILQDFIDQHYQQLKDRKYEAIIL